MDAFKLTVEQLGSEPEHHAYAASAEWWAARDEHERDELCEAETPFAFAVEVARVRDDLLLQGRLEGLVALECSRCAKRYSHALRDSFRLLLSPAAEREAVDPEGERGLARNGLCLGEDLETGWFRGPVIRLDELFGEVIALAMPLQPLCSERCPGICPHCGADRAETQCDCVDERIDSPFAVLARLKSDD